MESAMEAALIEALDALEVGEDIESIIARYPDYAAELRPMLLTATSMANMRIAHSLDAQAASKQRMLDYAAAAAPASDQAPAILLVLRRLSLAVATLLIALSLLGSGVLFASAESVPGDSLYDAKRFFEETRLSLTTSSAAKDALQERFQEERIREVETLIRMGRSEEVAFSGLIESIDGATWQVAGIEVIIVDSTVVEGAARAAVGQLVQITGLTVDGGVRASVVMIRSLGNLPEPSPEPDLLPEVTPDPSPTDTPTPTATPTSSSTPTPTPEETSQEPSPTSTSTPTATPTPTDSSPSGNANEGSNANGNQGEENGNEGGSNNNDDDDDDDDDERENGNNNGGNDNDNDNDNENDNERDDAEDS